MINDIISMNGYGIYVWSAFSFTLISFAILYFVVKINLVKEQNKFVTKFGLLEPEKVRIAKTQSTNREIIANSISSKI